MPKRVAFYVAAFAVATAFGCGPLAAQQGTQTPGIKRTILETHDLPGTKYEIVLAISEIAPNGAFPRHTHPGPETDYVLEGGFTLNAEGQPTRTLQAGQTTFIPEGVVHWGSAGPAGSKVVGVYVVEKGKPLASQAE